MEKYKNLLLDGIMQILLCIRSHFHHEKEREGTIFFLWSAQDGWKHQSEDEMKVLMKFWKLEACPLQVLHEVCCGQGE